MLEACVHGGERPRRKPVFHERESEGGGGQPKAEAAWAGGGWSKGGGRRGWRPKTEAMRWGGVVQMQKPRGGEAKSKSRRGVSMAEVSENGRGASKTQKQLSSGSKGGSKRKQRAVVHCFRDRRDRGKDREPEGRIDVGSAYKSAEEGKEWWFENGSA